MRIVWMLMLSIMWPLSASACSCAGGASHYFLNTVGERGLPSVYLPANAKGILFFADMTQGPVRYIDERTRLIATIPLALSAAQFSIVETDTGRSVPAVVTRLNVDRQMAQGQQVRFFLGPLRATSSDGLPDVTSDIRKAVGLFRVGPGGGFRAGRRYHFAYRPTDPLPRAVHTEVRLGPAVALSASDQYALGLEGPPTHALLTLPDDASCSAKQAAIVQKLTYTVPAALAPYHRGILFFTQQKVSSGEDGKIPVFTATSYRSSECANTQPGLGELGALKDLAVARCRRHGPAAQERLVKGYVGMLELEDTLHETATYRIPFDQSSKALCTLLGVFGRD